MGGSVRAGSAEIAAAPGGGSLSVVQTSDRAIIDWSSFSIGRGGAVDFRNGSGATLNRVTGGSISSLDGLLTASGSVYLVNPNGVVIGKDGRVDVGGSFVASTLGIAADDFLKGGDLTAAGASTAAVINYGKIGALGGDVVLTAARVENHGDIAAQNGATGLLAGYEVLLRDRTIEGGKFAVKLGDGTTSVVNDGAIHAAQAELRANGGDVFALAGNLTGVIDARGVSTQDGRIYLMAGDGALTVEGTLTARANGGGASFIETSGGKVTVGVAKVDPGAGGTWSLDPSELVIDSAAASSIQGALNDSANIIQSTNPGGGSGDITLSPGVSISWASAATLTLSAYRNIVFGAGATLNGGPTGSLVLRADNLGTGVGTLLFAAGSSATAVNVTLYYNPSSNPSGSIVNGTSYATADDFSSFVVASSFNHPTDWLKSYMLVNTVYDLQNIKNNLTGVYALGRSIDASATSGWAGGFAPIGSAANPFRGVFDGQGTGITGLVINRPTTNIVGIFAMSTGTLTNISTLGVNVTGQDVVGGLVGWNYGTISKIGNPITNPATVVSPTVTGGNYVGGLVGVNYGSINAGVGGTVSGTNYVGGMAGVNVAVGTISGATSGTVTGTAWYTGGIVGQNLGTATGSSSANVTGVNGTGGIVGDNEGTLTYATVTGRVSGANDTGGVVGVNGANGILSGLRFFDTGYVSGTAYYTGGLVGVNSGLLTSSNVSAEVHGTNASGGAVGVNYGTVQSTTVAGIITGSNYTGGVVGLNDQAGHVNSDSFTGGTITGTQFYTGGIVGQNGGTIDASSFLGTINGANGVGGGAGFSSGSLTNVTVTSNSPNSITGINYVGGLAGFNYGAIASSQVNATINGHDYVGGFVGWNGVGSSIVGGSAQGAAYSILAGYYGYYVGGIFGLNTGTVSGVTASNRVYGGTGVGGIGGINYGQVNNSSASGEVIGANSQTGGAIGLAQSGSISGVTATGAVTGADRTGGLVGENWGMISASHANNSGVRGGYNGGEGGIGGFVGKNSGGALITTSDASTSVTGAGHWAGGFAGINYGTITYSSAAGYVDNTQGGLGAGGFAGLSSGVIDNSHSSGTVYGLDSVGGFVGENDNVIRTSWTSGAANGRNSVGGFAGVNRGGEITTAYASGGAVGTDYVGGFVGYAGGYIANAYETGSITGSGSRVGGFVGALDGGMVASVYAAGRIINSGYPLGGVAGAVTNGGTLTNAYWDVGFTGTYSATISGPAGSSQPVNGPYGSPFAASSYPGLDFVNTWMIREGISRPTLRAFAPPS